METYASCWQMRRIHWQNLRMYNLRMALGTVYGWTLKIQGTICYKRITINGRPIFGAAVYLPCYNRLGGLDDAAGDFFAGIARRLRRKVIRLAVDHHSPPDNVGNMEAVCQEGHERAAIASEQRREVACMMRMRTTPGVKVAFRVGETDAAAGAAFVDMEAEYAGCAGRVAMREPAYISYNQGIPAVWVERHVARRAVGRAADMRDGKRAAQVESQMNHLVYSICRQRKSVRLKAKAKGNRPGGGAACLTAPVAPRADGRDPGYTGCVNLWRDAQCHHAVIADAYEVAGAEAAGVPGDDTHPLPRPKVKYKQAAILHRNDSRRHRCQNKSPPFQPMRRNHNGAGSAPDGSGDGSGVGAKKSPP